MPHEHADDRAPPGPRAPHVTSAKMGWAVGLTLAFVVGEAVVEELEHHHKINHATVQVEVEGMSPTRCTVVLSPPRAGRILDITIEYDP